MNFSAQIKKLPRAPLHILKRRSQDSKGREGGPGVTSLFKPYFLYTLEHALPSMAFPPSPSPSNPVNIVLKCARGPGVTFLFEPNFLRYALKALSKGYIVKMRMQKSVLREKEILLMCDSKNIRLRRETTVREA